MLGRRLVFGFDEARAAAVGVDHDAAEELEPALVVVGLPPVIRQELDAAAHQPVHGVGAVLDQRLGEIGIDVVLRDAAEIVEILLRGVFAEIGARDVGVAEIGHDAFDVLRAVMHHAEAATGKPGIAAALFFRRALEQYDPGAPLCRRQRGAQRGIAAADNDNIIRLIVHPRSFLRRLQPDTRRFI